MAKGELFQGLPMWAKGVVAIIIVGGAGVVVYTIYKKLQNASSKKDDKQELNAAQQELNQMSIKPTLTKSQAEGMANAIFVALDGYGTDESVIYNQLAKVKNNADWLLLVTSYGTKEISSGKGNFAPNYSGNLVGALNDELSSSEIATANEILKKNGVKYTI